MTRAVHLLPMCVLYLVLAIVLRVAATATAAPTTTIAGLSDQRRALYQAELEQNLLLRSQLGYGFVAELGPLAAPPA